MKQDSAVVGVKILLSEARLSGGGDQNIDEQSKTIISGGGQNIGKQSGTSCGLGRGKGPLFPLLRLPLVSLCSPIFFPFSPHEEPGPRLRESQQA